MRKLTVMLSPAAKRPNAGKQEGILSRLLAENQTCADCACALFATATFVNVRYGVFVCDECVGAHRVLPLSLVKDVGQPDAVSVDHLAFLSTMGNARANSLLEARLKQARGVEKPTSQSDTQVRSSFARAKYDELRWVAPGSPFPLYKETPGSPRAEGQSSPHARDVDELDYERVLKSGFLMKKKQGKNWKRRFCMLTPFHLAYFEDVEGTCVRAAVVCVV